MKPGIDFTDSPLARGGKTGEEARYTATRREHWDEIARQGNERKSLGGYYHRRLAHVYSMLIPPGASVLEIGCGRGDLLAALSPRRGVGIDFSRETIVAGRERHPDLTFVEADAHELDLGDETFEYIVLSDLINDVWDVQRVLERLTRCSTPGTRVILNSFSHLWASPLRFARAAGLATPVMPQNWLSGPDVFGLLNLAGFEVVKRWEDILLPLSLPPLSSIANAFLCRLWPFRYFALTQFLVARPKPSRSPSVPPPGVSVVIPARNEAGNIADLVRRTPEFPGGVELIFVEGGSSDATYETIEKEIAAHPERRCILLRQQGRGKGDAVRCGFAAATGEMLMILDADVSVLPEDLTRFHDALRLGLGEFINGVRSVYPMENEAMRFANIIGNKFFSIAFSWLLGQPIKDSLCGTKVLWKRDYERIAANRASFGEFDPFGDFDLLFGASKLNLKILDLPVRYHARTYGETNIHRWSHGWMLLRMVMFAARKIKFV